MINNPLHSATILRFLSGIRPEGLDERGRPDYLFEDPGRYASGVYFIEDPRNPYRGIFCRAKVNPFLALAGISYQASHQIFLAEDPGEVYVLHDEYPKRQDAFEIQGVRYYATAPAEPCQLGDTTAAWKISLSREKYPVGANRA